MADAAEPASQASAEEKAYAAAAEAAAFSPAQAEPGPVVEEAPLVVPAAEPVSFPAKAKRTSAKPAGVPAQRTRPAAKTAKAKPARPVKATGAGSAKPKIAKPKISKVPAAPEHPKPEAKKMSKSPEFVESVKKVVTDAQAKAMLAYEKGQAVLGDYADFAKGNVQAVVESGKVLATGLHDMGNDLIVEGRTTFETMASDARSLASVKSPSAFFKLHSDILARNLDHAVELTSKNGEAMLKLGKDVVAPLTGRVTLAVEKLRKAA